MSDTKPSDISLDAAITFMRESADPDEINCAITEFLEELKRIHEAEMPEPVAFMIWAPMSGPAQFTTDKNAPMVTARRADYICTPLYGPELIAYAQRKDAEASKWQSLTKAVTKFIGTINRRHEKEKAALLAKYSKLMEAAELDQESLDRHEDACKGWIDDHHLKTKLALHEALAALKEKS